MLRGWPLSSRRTRTGTGTVQVPKPAAPPPPPYIVTSFAGPNSLLCHYPVCPHLIRQLKHLVYFRAPLYRVLIGTNPRPGPGNPFSVSFNYAPNWVRPERILAGDYSSTGHNGPKGLRRRSGQAVALSQTRSVKDSRRNWPLINGRSLIIIGRQWNGYGPLLITSRHELLM